MQRSRCKCLALGLQRQVMGHVDQAGWGLRLGTALAQGETRAESPPHAPPDSLLSPPPAKRENQTVWTGELGEFMCFWTLVPAPELSGSMGLVHTASRTCQNPGDRREL